MMINIRSYTSPDLDSLYRICLLTGASGGDASRFYCDSKIVGHVYAAPYAVFRPESALVVEDNDGVGGYILGASDTWEFESELETKWWPRLRAEYPDPFDVNENDLSWDQRMQRLIHHPRRTPIAITDLYPAHLHIDLLPRLQGIGLGKLLVDRWLGLMRSFGAIGVHLGVGATNKRAVRFYRAYGFHELDSRSDSFTFAMHL